MDAFERRNRIVRMRDGNAPHRMAGQARLIQLNFPLLDQIIGRRRGVDMFMRIPFMADGAAVPFLQG